MSSPPDLLTIADMKEYEGIEFSDNSDLMRTFFKTSVCLRAPRWKNDGPENFASFPGCSFSFAG